nr:rhomboid family intramembrane serine protease [Candidatus Bathyarchaeota archaeon]
SPIVNYTIIAASTAIYLWQTTSTPAHFTATLFHYGLIPRFITNGQRLPTLITNIFLHGGWTHLAGNMLFLWIFGDNIEDCCGHLRYLLFYTATGIAAGLIWTLTAANSSYPAVGGSGAISGVLGAYLIFYPRAKIRTLIGAGLFFRIIRIPASAMIGLWFVYQIILASLPMNTGVAYWAHIGGFAAGLALSRIMRPKLRGPSPLQEWR